ncbi:hypothetical protein [Kutzneria chonburiensis]|uniref:hypothetical protein n=1 Tax=Kutzneria chonburiensis TaxID=1483604 RepID=UPI00235E59A2|nr:hypothetical protein [Kutzneria chonburiensis]
MEVGGCSDRLINNDGFPAPPAEQASAHWAVFQTASWSPISVLVAASAARAAHSQPAIARRGRQKQPPQLLVFALELCGDRHAR